MATGAYDANGIWQYGESDDISLFSDLLNKSASSVSTAFTADRARLATLEAGSLAALVPVKPSTVTFTSGTGGVNGKGTIDFTNCSKVAIAGCFTGYDNYKVFGSIVSSTGLELLSRYMNGAGEVTTANYSIQFIEGIGSSLSTQRFSGQSQGRWAYHTANTRSGLNTDVYLPGAATFTVSKGSMASHNGGAWIQEYVNSYPTNDVFTGISLFSNAGQTFSGKISVLGWNN